MIVKILDLDSNWSWFGDVKEASKLGFYNPNTFDAKAYGLTYVDIVGTENDANADALIMRLAFRDGGEKIMAFYARQAYLVDDKTGSTIDSLIP